MTVESYCVVSVPFGENPETALEKYLGEIPEPYRLRSVAVRDGGWTVILVNKRSI
jgi:hypothetical protein